MEEGVVQEQYKAVWCRRKVDVGVLFFPSGSFNFPGTGSKERIPFCWEVDLIFKSAARNITQMFIAKDIPPRTIF